MPKQERRSLLHMTKAEFHPEITSREAFLLALLGLEEQRNGGTIAFFGFSRRSERQFDFEFQWVKNSGKGNTLRGSSWMPLHAIRDLTLWPRPEIAEMTLYPSMTQAGDWSGVRDSGSECIWAIFRAHVMPLLLKAEGRR